MKKLIALFVVIFVFALPLVALKAKCDAEKEMRRPTPPKYTVQEQIAALNAGYEQMWALEQTAPKAASSESPEPRYRITDEERREIERIVASEGGYCEYRFQALVAQCILNGAERDNVRPSKLFERGDFYITRNVEPTEVTKRAVSDVFDKGVFPTNERVMYYYNPQYCNSAAHESKRYILTCCGCRFFAEWGD